MSLTAKFTLSTLTLSGVRQSKATLTAVSRGDRNACWAAATPSGTIELGTLTADETAWIVGHRDTVRAASDDARATLVAAGETNTSRLHWADRGVEFDVYLSRPDAGPIVAPVRDTCPIIRHMQLAQPVLGSPDFPNQGNLKWTSLDDSAWATVSMYVNNQSAWRALNAEFEAGHVEWYLMLAATTDGYPDDGHAYRTAAYPQGTYGWDRCGECSGALVDHLSDDALARIAADLDQ